MSDQLPKKRSKRGRPPKLPEKKSKPDSDLSELSKSQNPTTKQEKAIEKPKHQSDLLEVYNNLRASFLNTGVSQQSQLLIRRISSNLSSSGEISSQLLFRILNEVLQELTLNELEVVSWAIALDRYNWKENTMPIQNLLLNVAFAVKNQLNEDIAPYKAYLSSKSADYMDEYSSWAETIKPLMSINAKDINNKFKELGKLVGVPGDSKIQDYNYYVDEILQISQPAIQDVKDESLLSVKKYESSGLRKASDFDFESSTNNNHAVLPKVEVMPTNFLEGWDKADPSFHSPASKS
ncbi:unnamed protein product [Blepharisma stoltei]|uniref:Uncharacterized protein n=1 Tax=Blepharisma stoltei TaxID=1481888 RepID=A0AAU9JJP9_9CILI|nr:unnamed protein product [Blepharisma stoltei]